jgi:protein gp37
MAAQSSIEWTEMTWNPVTGCTKVSEGCRQPTDDDWGMQMGSPSTRWLRRRADGAAQRQVSHFMGRRFALLDFWQVGEGSQ